MVCHGNIARSQVLHHYLQRSLIQLGVEADLFSCGTVPADAYTHADELLRDVQAQLDRRGLKAIVERTPWSAEAAEVVRRSDIVLAADEARRQDVLSRTGIDPTRVFLFYEYIGEGSRDFVDTFDHGKGRQDPDRYAGCFDELERIAQRAASRISATLAGAGRRGAIWR